jgi:hypothetical protein
MRDLYDNPAPQETPFPSGESFAQSRRNSKSVSRDYGIICQIHQSGYLKSQGCLFCKQGHKPVTPNKNWRRGDVVDHTRKVTKK